MTAFDADAYLKRIGLTAPPEPTVEGLNALQRAQVLAIPFENFDIMLGRGISLEPDAVFDKLVRRRRGGYCFEINGLLLTALQAFGFEARALLGRVHLMGQTTGRSHQISLVTIDGTHWIAD
uniref:arylamine N-acetyltransferase family protein n=1 Tax=uncultured Phenylobacterium sp. TaxID=349273 RepID=UPI0025F78BB1